VGSYICAELLTGIHAIFYHWYSRYILSWEISNTLTTDFCLKAVNDALKSGQKPEIFNTDRERQARVVSLPQMTLQKP
jgi:transposase InsO family protein